MTLVYAGVVEGGGEKMEDGVDLYRGFAVHGCQDEIDGLDFCDSVGVGSDTREASL